MDRPYGLGYNRGSIHADRCELFHHQLCPFNFFIEFKYSNQK
jgi:hypothetical protein